jgi:hypothetical protein
MRKTIFFIFLIFIDTLVYSQNQDFKRLITISVYSKIGMNQPIRLTRKYVTEDVGPFHGKESWSAGLKCSGMLSRKLRLEIAAGYALHSAGFELSPPIYPESKIYPETIRTYNIPITLLRYFRKYFFMSFGTIMDFEVPRKSYWIDSQNGFGFSLGVGKEFHVRNVVMELTPNLELHSVIPFNSVKDQQRFLVFGLKVGLGYCFHKPDKEKSNIAFKMTDMELSYN